MKINEKIYMLRKEHNMSQEALADKLNVSRQTVSKWELGESCPDFDKIGPLCALFGITADELINDRKTEKTVDNKPDVLKAFVISFSILLYFVAIAYIVLGAEFLNLNDGILVSGFLLICGLATVLIVFICMLRPDKKERVEKEEDGPIVKGIIGVVSTLTTIIYLLVSFMTMAWHITWLIWLIYALIVKIIRLAYDMKEDNNEK